MRIHQENGCKVAEFLAGHPKVKKVNYPGLKSHSQYQLSKKQMSGYSGLLGFELFTDDLNHVKTFFNHLNVFQIGVSWGGHESLVYAPAISYIVELPKQQFENMDISIGSIRLSIGLENSEDLIKDLDQAIQKID